MTNVYAKLAWYAFVIKRTTIEIDQQLLERAKSALRQPTTRATVKEALRRAAEQAEQEFEERAARQREYLRKLPELVDLDVLASGEMWR